jgi:hypothetical protein
MDALDMKVITNFMIAQSVTILLLIDELERHHPGLKTRYGAVLDALIGDEEAISTIVPSIITSHRRVCRAEPTGPIPGSLSTLRRS